MEQFNNQKQTLYTHSIRPLIQIFFHIILEMTLVILRKNNHIKQHKKLKFDLKIPTRNLSNSVNASAPATISKISPAIIACRARSKDLKIPFSQIIP